tara:strand:+ start:6059 stop:6313 length:255 start_codon:yes stop_codon:yes gene_type:complete
MLKTSNAEYRKLLVNNSAQIAKKNFDNVSKNCCLPPQYSNVKTNNTPHLFNKCDNQYPYMESDLKRQYMEKYNEKCSTFSTVFK